jgi:hypothetical protein
MPSGTGQAPAPAPDVTQDFATMAAAATFHDAAEVNDWFKGKVHLEFIPWFRANLGEKGAWAKKNIGGAPEVADRFTKIWDLAPTMFGGSTFNLLQFCCLMSIFINEVGADLLPLTEIVGKGLPGHPGLSYPFDEIERTKHSYNKAPNKTAYECFTNADFKAAHGALAPAASLAAPDRTIWSGTVYPQATFPFALDYDKTGFIQEADFFKFRGRGFIQATWRDMYLRCIQFVQNYAGTNPKILAFKALWAGQNADKVATQSTNAQWDDLFHNSDFEMACEIVFLHNGSHGKYLALSPIAADLNGQSAGSIWWMGYRISGGTGYADLYRRRLLEMFSALGNGARSPAPPSGGAADKVATV